MNTKRTASRLLSVLLCLVMVLGLFPTAAFAAETEGTTKTTVEVSTYVDLKNAMEGEGETCVKLTHDITTESLNSDLGIAPSDVITVKGKVTLDLNHHKIVLTTTSGSVTNFIHVSEGGSLTIDGSAREYNSYIEMKHSGVSGFSDILVDGDLTVENGTIKSYETTNLNYSYLIYNRSGTVTINGDSRISNGSIKSGAEKINKVSHALYDGRDSKAVTINGGTFNGLVTLWAKELASGATAKKVINGGTFNDSVALNGTDLENAKSPLDVAINSGTFYTKYRAASYDRYPYFQQFGVPEGTWKYHHDREGYIDAGAFASIFPDDATILCPAYEYTGNAYGIDEVSSGPARVFSGSDDPQDLKYFLCESMYPAIMVYRGDLSDLKLTPQDGTALESGGQGTIEQGKNSFTVSFRAPKSLIDLCWQDKSGVSLAPEVLVLKNTTTTLKESDVGTVSCVLQSDGTYLCSFTITLTEPAQNGDTYGIVVNVQSVLESDVQAGGSLLGAWTLTAELPKTLTGTVHYTSSAVYDKPISTNVTGLPDELDNDDLTRQWQRSTDGGSSWTDIKGATGNQYCPTEYDMGDSFRLRVRMTAEGWYGELVSAPVKVSKAANNKDPGIPALTAEKDAYENYTTFTITDFDKNKQYVEYVYTDSAFNGWPTSGTPIDSDTVSGLTPGTTCYVYARYKGTDTTEAGTVVRRGSVLLADVTRLNRLVLSDSGQTYTDYGAGNTIYVEKDESVTLNVTKNPSGANTWNPFTVESPSEQSVFSVTEPTSAVASGSKFTSITIEGKSVGSEILGAYYNSRAGNYGTWWVIVYDPKNVDSGHLRLASTPEYEDLTLSVNDTAALPTALPALLPANSGYTLEWRIPWSSTTGGGYTLENENIKLEDGKIVPKAAHTSGSTRLSLVAVDANGETSAINGGSCSFTVTVTAAPEINLTGLTVSPTKVYLDLNGTTQLNAAKTPVNAEGTLSWSSNNENVATVDADGHVTAVAPGTAKITVTCDGKTATCTVLVNHEHSYSDTWTSGGDAGHYQTCSCGSVKTAPHSFTKWTEVDKDTHKSTCDEGCGTTTTGSHTWVYDETSSTPATEIKEGTAVYTCFCGATKTETIAKLPPSDSGSGGGVSAYTVTVKDAKHGSVTADRKTASAGTTVTLTVSPNQGWTLETLTAANASGKEIDLNIVKVGEKYTFKMPASNVTVNATFMEDNTILNYFVDVPTNSYYYDAVLWAVEQGITQGTDNSHFNPSGICTRAQAVTFLWRAAGSPAPKSSTMPFTDVKSGVYYYDAVLWAVENGITKGTTDTTFSPNMNCSRAQIVTFLWRSEKSPAAGTVNPFTDVKADAYYADAVLWAVKEDVTKGTTDTTFSPDTNCTRAQIVTFIYRCMK